MLSYSHTNIDSYAPLFTKETGVPFKLSLSPATSSMSSTHCYQVGKFQRQTIPPSMSSSKVQKFNIVTVSVCPGLSRSDATAPLLNTARG
ncbi:hypothetical protein BDR07DRAFT_624895 [Suillus spraguei]|nr:hypothetical protein BDR07DRAFT_624895 [Suillus spraguei]